MTAKSRHVHFETYCDGMLRTLMHPTVTIPGEGDQPNPLWRMDEANSSGPIQSLIRAWSLVGDVLTFYQERIAEERDIDRAREEFSAYSMTRMFGYVPQPVISARAWLCFLAGADKSDHARIPQGMQVANVPPEGKLPSIFETSSALDAFADWGAVPLAAQSRPAIAKLSPNATRLVLEGSDQIVPGSAVVMRIRTGQVDRLVAALVSDTLSDRARNVTLVRWQSLPPNTIVGGEEIVDVRLLETSVRPFGALAPPYTSASAADRRKYAFGGVAVRDGAAWQPLSSGLSDAPLGLAYGRGVLFGIAGPRLFRKGAGDSWSVTTPFTAYPAQSITTTPGGLLAVGTATGNVLVSIDDGLTWSLVGAASSTPAKKLGRFQMRSLANLPIHGIAIDESGEVPTVFVATDRGVASIALNEDVWTWRNDGFPGTNPKTGVASLGVTSIVVADADGTLLVTTTYGVFRSKRGESWNRVWGLGSVSGITSLADGSSIAIGPGGVFRSDDGVTWEKALTVDGLPRTLASGATTAVVAVGNDLYLSDDGGKTWTAAGDPLKTPIHAAAVARDGRIAVASPFVDDPKSDWPGLELSGDVLSLDREVAVQPGDIVAVSLDLDGSIACEAYVVRSVRTAMLSEFGLTGISTQLRIDRAISDTLRDARHAIVHVGGRMRAAVAVKRESSEPPTLVLDVPRGLTPLQPGRQLAIEGRPIRVQLAALAGGPFAVSAAGAAPLPDTLRALRDNSIGLDVEAVASLGDAGVIVARCDGIWRCADLSSAPWEKLPSLPRGLAARSLACFDSAVYATCESADENIARSGVYLLSGDQWILALGGAMRRVVVAAGVLWACADTGLYILADGAWSIADPLLERLGFSYVAADEHIVLAASDDGVYIKEAGSWRRLPGFNGIAVNVIEITPNAWFAGTRTAGTWKLPLGNTDWEAVATGRNTDVVALAVIDGNAVVASERGVGISLRGETTDATLATNVVAFIDVQVQGERSLLAFRGVPVLPPVVGGDGYVPMRRFVVSVNDNIETGALDAGMLTPSTRARVEAALNAKLSGFELVVDESGSAWRLEGIDPLPVYAIRREATSFSIFEVERFELESPPTLWPGSLTKRWPLLGDWVSPPALLALDDDLWYTVARSDANVAAEISQLAAQSDTQIVLQRPLTRAFDPLSVNICGNVVEATNGATIARDEVLLSGDASVPAQTATLANKPLSNVVDDGSVAPALQVWVRADVPSDPLAATAALSNRGRDEEMIRWKCVPNFSQSGPAAPHFTLQQDHEGRATLTFGDGEIARRLPTGRDNVVARYRVGGGADGNVVANSLTLFQRPHAGLSKVYNPLAARGGADADRVADVRTRATLGLISMGRVVSEMDLLDYVSAWSGVEKVSLARVPRQVRSTTRSKLVVTVAPASVDTDELQRVLRRDGAKNWNIQFVTYRERRFSLHATLLVDPAYDAATARSTAEAALLGEYAFPRRDLRQDVYESAIIALLQSVAGVSAVTIGALFENSGLHAAGGRLLGDDESAEEAASVLIIDPSGLELKVMPS